MAVAPLTALFECGFDIALVVTGADKRRGRRSEPSSTPVKEQAMALGLPVSHEVGDSLEVGADLGVVVAFGQLLRRPVLERLPMINLHFSLLPRWRGAAPVERALLAGDRRTGVCVMAVDETLDTGAIYAERAVPIGDRVTAAELGSELTALGSTLLVDTLRVGLTEPRPQTGEATYAAKIGPSDLLLDWTRPAAELDRVVRVGGAWTTFRGRRLKIHEAMPSTGAATGRPGELHGTTVFCGDGSLDLLTVQPEGKARVDASAWANGAHLVAGDVLGEEPPAAESGPPS